MNGMTGIGWRNGSKARAKKLLGRARPPDSHGQTRLRDPSWRYPPPVGACVALTVEIAQPYEAAGAADLEGEGASGRSVLTGKDHE